MAPFWSSSQKKGRAKKKIPGQIRFLPELDCISLEGVEQHFEDINFLYTIGQRFFQGGCGGPVKVYWFGSCTKKMVQLERTGAPVVPTLVFLLAQFCIFLYSGSSS